MKVKVAGLIFGSKNVKISDYIDLTVCVINKSKKQELDL